MDAVDRRRLGVNLARLAGGDRGAFDAVFTSLWPPLLALASRLLGNDEEAQDAAQEALMKVFGNIEQYDASRDALSWAFAITAFEVRTLRKRRVRRREARAATLEQASTTRTPEGDLGDAELRTRLVEAVDLLSEHDRAEIGAYLGLGAEGEASAALGAARRKRRQRALERLKSIWRSLHGFHP